MNYYWWGLLAVVFFLLEIPTQGFVLFWLGIGAMAAGIVKIAGVDSLGAQTAVFVGVSAILVLSTRKIAKQWLHNKPTRRTNMDALIDQIGVVTVPIDNSHSTGRMLVLGQDWLARSEHGEPIPATEKVRIVRSEGATLVVRPIGAG